MKIYTGFGDQGKTALFGGKNVPKNHPRVEVYGQLDELNSVIGLIVAKDINNDPDHILRRIQNELFVVSSEIATPDRKKTERFSELIGRAHQHSLEKEIDRLSAHLPELKNFILPGGCEAAALCHLARTVCRRAERALVGLMREEDIRQDILIYLNRLGDLLFVLSRFYNHRAGLEDTPWKGLAG